MSEREGPSGMKSVGGTNFGKIGELRKMSRPGSPHIPLCYITIRIVTTVILAYDPVKCAVGKQEDKLSRRIYLQGFQ